MPDDPTVTYLIYPFVLLLIVSPNFFRIYGLIALALVYTVSYSQDLTSLSSRWLIWGLFGVFLTLLVALSPAQLFFTKEEQRDPIQHIEVLHPSLHGEKMSAGAEVEYDNRNMVLSLLQG
jgi:energy-coupling factor transporter transmembrane protein EcfT